ncbi:MAG: DNA cytosine methyltransferase, partial [Candidatus Enteromonas sp.]
MRKYRFIDLFAGIGGFHQALTNLGHKCVCASEIDEDAIKRYKENFPDTP